MKKLLYFLGVLIIFSSFISLHAMEQQQPETGEGKEGPPPPAKKARVRRSYFRQFQPPQEIKSLQYLTAKPTLKLLLEASNMEEVLKLSVLLQIGLKNK